MRLKRRQFQVRLISSLVILILVFFATLIIDALALIFSADLFSTFGSTLSVNFENYFQQHPDVIFRLVAPAFLTGPASALITYFTVRWRQGSQTKELSSLISRMKKSREEYDQRQKVNPDQRGGIVDDAFSLTDQILRVLPEVARKRTLDSFIFGFGAFMLALIIGQPGIGLLVGAAVWLYMRYETNRSYEREIAKLEEQKKYYEQRKDAFLATL
ncbi:MAG: hypothetical protein JRN67_12345 [Nitrososphaerota archaeon]|jgi:hypothetical protein|nr:hypothetical protein [Nitrososphaerota archaeon]